MLERTRRIGFAPRASCLKGSGTLFHRISAPPRDALGSAEHLAGSAARDRAEQGLTVRRKLRALAAGVAGDPGVGVAPGAPETPASFALRHHAVYEINRACDARDELRLRDALTLTAAADDVAGATDEGYALVVVDASECRKTADRRFDSTVCTATTRAIRAPAMVAATLLDNAIEAVREAGLLRYVVEGVGVLVLCERALEFGTPAFSYSLGALPNTVFTDWSEDPVILGESMLHEGAHCWLNAALAAEREQLAREPLVYSPWKDTGRPPFGLIHAVLAFSLLATYFRAVAASGLATGPTLRYCELRASVERHRLSLAQESLDVALQQVDSAAITDLIRAHFAEATKRDLVPTR